ncbi:hypothetical protein SNE40_012396 [Patella caerulea]|uniref:NADAR domain-containing protein n=1 Tax=Patella caerulea TaxID=87958 RepID=A0AAN8JR64_PATCE
MTEKTVDVTDSVKAANVDDSEESETSDETNYRLLSKDDVKGKNRYVYFYGKDSVFSQHHKCEFEIDGIKLCCAEQYFMYMKADTFGDEIMKKAILESTQPVEMKRCGKKIKNYDPDEWGEKAVDVVKRGNAAKFSQNKDLRKELFATYPKILVEASPRDRRWGIGMSGKNEKAWDSKTWRGKNLLGYALTDVRDQLMRDEDLID